MINNQNLGPSTSWRNNWLLSRNKRFRHPRRIYTKSDSADGEGDLKLMVHDAISFCIMINHVFKSIYPLNSVLYSYINIQRIPYLFFFYFPILLCFGSSWWIRSFSLFALSIICELDFLFEDFLIDVSSITMVPSTSGSCFFFITVDLFLKEWFQFSTVLLLGFPWLMLLLWIIIEFIPLNTLFLFAPLFTLPTKSIIFSLISS